VNAVSFQGSGVGKIGSSGFGLYSKKGMVNGKTNLPTPSVREVTTRAMARAVKGLTLKLKNIPSFSITFFHHFLM